jgi:hypothetical protein
MSIIDGQSLLTQSFLYTSTGTNNEKLLRICNTQFTELDDQFELIRLLNVIYSNTGLTLDDLGENLTLAREPGQSDALYQMLLTIAVASQESTGTIPELISIGKSMAGATGEATGTLFELWRLTGEEYWDGTFLLNGTKMLNPAAAEPAAIEFGLEGEIGSMPPPLNVGEIIDQVRAAGIYAKYRLHFISLVSDMVLNGGDINQPSELALGDGATRAALAADTALENEVFRRTVATKDEGDGNWSYTVYLDTTELNSYSINEIALFDTTGTMICKRGYFTSIPKTSDLVYEYSIIDDTP